MRIERINRPMCAFCSAEAKFNVGGILLGTTISGGTNVCQEHRDSVALPTVPVPEKFLKKPSK